MIDKYLLIALLIIGWASSPYIKKKATPSLSGMEYYMVHVILCTILIVPIWLICCKDKNLLNKMKTNEISWACCSAFVTTITGILICLMVKHYEVSNIIPQVQPVVILISVLIGVFLFKESIHINKIFGIGLILSGLIIMNYKK